MPQITSRLQVSPEATLAMRDCSVARSSGGAEAPAAKLSGTLAQTAAANSAFLEKN
jgi:hypothetical protein